MITTPADIAGLWLENCVSNIITRKYKLKHMFHPDLDKFQGRKWVIVGPGPQLDEGDRLERIRSLIADGYLVAIPDRSMVVCKHHGIKPDVVVCADPDFNKNYGTSWYYPEESKDITLIASLKCGRYFINNWQGPLYWWIHHGSYFEEQFDKLADAFNLPGIQELSTVACLARMILYLWDAEDVIDFGCDHTYYGKEVYYPTLDSFMVHVTKYYADPLPTGDVHYSSRVTMEKIITDHHHEEHRVTSFPYPLVERETELGKEYLFTDDMMRYNQEQFEAAENYAKELIESGLRETVR